MGVSVILFVTFALSDTPVRGVVGGMLWYLGSVGSVPSVLSLFLYAVFVVGWGWGGGRWGGWGRGGRRCSWGSGGRSCWGRWDRCLFFVTGMRFLSGCGWLVGWWVSSGWGGWSVVVSHKSGRQY